MMKKAICVLASCALLLATTGCANGPIRNWFRGSACNTCTPPVGQPAHCGTNMAPSCANGVCGSGVQMQGPVMNAPASQPIQNGAVPLYEEPILNANPVYGQPTSTGPTTQSYRLPSAEVYGVGSFGDPIVPPRTGSGF